MSGESGNDLFDSLKGMGLTDLDDIELYKDEEKKKEAAAESAPKTSPQDFIFDRKVKCPVCSKDITVKAVKSAGIRVVSRDTDLMTYYQEPDPSFYDAWFCSSCGYAAMSAKFSTISDTQAELVRKNISSKWQFNKVYPPVYDVDTAIEIHKLALLNTIVKMGRNSEKAMICLKLGWLFRLNKNQAEEIKFLTEAKNGFLRAYESESFPISGMDKPTLEYLIGELFRRVGDNENALQWLSKVLVDRTAKQKIKDIAREQKDLIFSKKC